jgi:hypothetical protein
MRRKLESGKRKFTDREHSAYVCEVQQNGDDDEAREQMALKASADSGITVNGAMEVKRDK